MIDVSLSHRLMCGYDASEIEDMTGAIETSLFKATAIINLVASSIIDPDNNGALPETLYWSIRSSLSDLADITAVIDAYHLACSDKEQAQKNPEL